MNNKLINSPPFAQRLESHPWFEVGQTLDGETANRYLHTLNEQNKSHPHPYCIYVHVPFCASICRYCALYTRAVRGHQTDAIFDEYLDKVSHTILGHPQAYNQLGPTTVHFGGGTPLHLGITRFTKLTDTLRKVFGNPAGCEWALETTTSALNTEMIAALHELGFRRIHLGIQTLDNNLRSHYRRHESGEAALEKIHYLQQQNFQCSVDLIVGFADSNADILYNDLQRLYNVGVRMFSICELRQRQGKELTDKKQRLQSRRNYQLWKIIWEFMEQVELRPIHLGQFARSQTDNLYYTYPARGEHCIAIGPYAHGSAGPLYYSNKLLPDYYTSVQMGLSPIANAVLYDEQVRLIIALECELLSHHIHQSTLDNLIAIYPLFITILEFWQIKQLILKSMDQFYWSITVEGSWFIGNMIMQIRDLVTSDVARATPYSHHWC